MRLFVAIELSDDMKKAAVQILHSLRKAFDAAGIDYDRKKFTPHITLVRKSSGKPERL